jgi:hypothetical protein
MPFYINDTTCAYCWETHLYPSNLSSLCIERYHFDNCRYAQYFREMGDIHREPSNSQIAMDSSTISRAPCVSTASHFIACRWEWDARRLGVQLCEQYGPAWSTFLHQPVRWPSGLRRQLKVNPNTLVRKGVGSNPTLINIFFAFWLYLWLSRSAEDTKDVHEAEI